MPIDLSHVPEKLLGFWQTLLKELSLFIDGLLSADLLSSMAFQTLALVLGCCIFFWLVSPLQRKSGKKKETSLSDLASIEQPDTQWEYQQQYKKVEQVFELFCAYLSKEDQSHEADILSLRPDRCAALITEALLLKKLPCANAFLMDRLIQSMNEKDYDGTAKVLLSSIKNQQQKIDKLKEQLAMMERVLGLLLHTHSKADALYQLNQASQVFNFDPILLLNLATLQMEKGDYEETTTLLLRLLKKNTNALDPEVVACIHSNLSISLRTQGNLNEAVHHHNEALIAYRQLRDQTGLTRQHAEFAYTLLDANQIKEGLAQINVALKLYKSQRLPLIRMQHLKAMLLDRSGDSAEAIKILEKSLKNDSLRQDSQLRDRINAYIKKLKKRKSAPINMPKAASKNPEKPIQTQSQERTYESSEVLTRGLIILTSYASNFKIQSRPQTEDELLEIMADYDIAIKESQTKKALEQLKRALALTKSSSHPHWAQFLHIEIARSHMHLKQFEMALSSLLELFNQKEVLSSSMRIECALNLAICNAEKAAFDKAYEYAVMVCDMTDRNSAFNFEYAMASVVLACCEYHLGNLMAVRSHFFKAFQMMPKKYADELCIITSCLSLVCLSGRSLDEAEKYSMQAFSMCTNEKILEKLADDLVLIGQEKSQRGIIIEGRHLYKKAQKIYASLGLKDQERSLLALITEKASEPRTSAPKVFPFLEKK